MNRSTAAVLVRMIDRVDSLRLRICIHSRIVAVYGVPSTDYLYAIAAGTIVFVPGRGYIAASLV